MNAKDDELERLSDALKVKEEAMGQAMGGLCGEKEKLQKTIEQLVAQHQEELHSRKLVGDHHQRVAEGGGRITSIDVDHSTR